MGIDGLSASVDLVSFVLPRPPRGSDVLSASAGPFRSIALVSLYELHDPVARPSRAPTDRSLGSSSEPVGLASVRTSYSFPGRMWLRAAAPAAAPHIVPAVGTWKPPRWTTPVPELSPSLERLRAVARGGFVELGETAVSQRSGPAQGARRRQGAVCSGCSESGPACVRRQVPIRRFSPIRRFFGDDPCSSEQTRDRLLLIRNLICVGLSGNSLFFM